MNTYTDELRTELERVIGRGNPDGQSFKLLASIIYRIDARISALETAQAPAAPVVETPAAPVEEVVEEVVEAPAEDKASVSTKGRKATKKD